LLRIDFETPPSHEILQAKLAEYERRVADADVVLLSDYGKGGLTHISEMIRIARAAGYEAPMASVEEGVAEYMEWLHARV
jgi:bifunctional ADP-heptose synthase (sugar kinase/adenylyltransferase)